MPKKETYIVKIVSSDECVYGTDNNEDIWLWGKSITDEEKIAEKPKDGNQNSPSKLIWFKHNHKEVLQVRCGKNITVFLVEN